MMMRIISIKYKYKYIVLAIEILYFLAATGGQKGLKEGNLFGIWFDKIIRVSLYIWMKVRDPKVMINAFLMTRIVIC